MSADVERLPTTRRVPSDVRETLTWLAHLLDSQLAHPGHDNATEFARQHLDPGDRDLASCREALGAFSAPLVARTLALDFAAHPPAVIAGFSADSSPKWARLDLGDRNESVPCGLLAAFAAGVLMPVPVVIEIDTRWGEKEVVVHVAAEHVEHAEAYLNDLMERALTTQNHLRGRCLQLSSTMQGLTVEPVPRPTATRADVIVAEEVWTEIDLNTAALFGRRDLLERLKLGTNRGLLLVGPPGTGKSAVCRVLAAELAGDVTVVLCTASAIAHSLVDVYDEVARLTPALVVLEDIDLVIGRRGHGNDTALHGFLTALDGAMSRHRDVVTIATTNDVEALDAAATRAARFDRVIRIPLPGRAERVEILRLYLGPLAGAVAIGAVADETGGASGADLRELVRRAVLVDGEDVSTAGLLRLARARSWAPAETGLYL